MYSFIHSFIAPQQDQIQAEQSGSVSICPLLFLLSYSCRWGRTHTGILKRNATGGRGNDAQIKPAPDLLRISKTLNKHLLLMSCLLRLGIMKRFGSDSQKPTVWIQRNESNRDDPAGGIKGTMMTAHRFKPISFRLTALIFNHKATAPRCLLWKNECNEGPDSLRGAT